MKNKAQTQILSQLWSQVVEILTLKQYERCMGGDMSYRSKAERAMKASKDQDVQALCQEIISVYDTHFAPKVEMLDAKFFEVFE